MWSRLARRVIQLPVVIWVVYTVTFLLMSAAPGDPLIGEESKVPREVLEQQRRIYGLDQRWYVRYVSYARAFFVAAGHGRIELGRSIRYKGKPVAALLGVTAETWPTGALKTSLTLGVMALALAVLVGLNLGMLAGTHQNRLADHITMGVSVVGVSLPPFVTGSLLILALAVTVPFLPVGGWGRPGQMVLPAVTLSLPFAAYIARLMRAGLVDTLASDCIRTARAKGLPESRVIYHHAFRLAFLPVLSFLGPATASILTGSFVVEQLFAVPGIGRHFVHSVLHRDYPLILGTVLLYAILLVTFNLLVDVAYLFVDPRISREEAV